ncbi:MAG: sensor histidine kinase N-terminal domain-containing protein [Zoogloeaceae bacterium]|nr:sensor histidine kinase N-terminal domain-containing protein [Zoogloeaceae bacterium]
MLAPLLFVWPLSIAATHYFASSVATYPYDQALRENVNALARQVKFVSGKPVINLPSSVRAMLRADEIDHIYFHVVNRKGFKLAGDTELRVASNLEYQSDELGEIYYREAEINGQDLRVAYTYVGDPSIPRERWLLIEVAETLEKRAELSNKIIASVILPQFVIIPLAVVLVWFGLSQGLQPLTRLRERIEARAENDMSPIRTRRVPEELQPLIDAFNAMLERMRGNLDAQQRFIADAAHQLRTPLTGLKTQAQLAMRESDPEELKNSLRQIATGVDRAAHLVNQLLTLARAEASSEGQHTLTPLNPDLLVRELVEEWVIQALDRQIDLGYEPAPAAEILGNALLLRELISNLIDNAMRYTPAGGSVTCRAVVHGDFVTLEVEDSGIGISEEQAALVFERFYRVDGTGVDGSGLGLAIVREIAELHHANASLRPNTNGCGAIARVVFPRYRPPIKRPEFDAQVEGELGFRNPPTGFV